MLGFVIGVIVSGIGVYAATTITSANISYDNSKSGLTSTDLKGAIDELYEKYEKSDIRKQGNFVSAYTYSTASSTKCITGEEETCKKSTCYKSKTSGSCKAGDIIKYKVNDTDIVTFHVMYDNGSTLTMQSQKNTINNTEWYKDDDDNSKGPLTVLPALEKATKGWSNVNNQTYTMGSTDFNGNAATRCYDGGTRLICEGNQYTLPERIGKARMITAHEATSFGCKKSENTCPIWMYNYLYKSNNYGGTQNDDSTYGNLRNEGYWTMSSYGTNFQGACLVLKSGIWSASRVYETAYGARAVVVVNK